MGKPNRKEMERTPSSSVNAMKNGEADKWKSRSIYDIESGSHQPGGAGRGQGKGKADIVLRKEANNVPFP
jgi:hypothetical protein